ncbi:MAG: glycosyltransferase [Candidatus Andersenbacteria bacterium]|nr:glycosyltransferase [Candidatus Andersenbacteria bacterium]
MTLAFITTQQPSASTVLGRILPLAQELKKDADIAIYVMSEKNSTPRDGMAYKIVGQEPFSRTEHGKIRLKGFALTMRLLKNTWHTFTQLIQDKPDVIVIVKPLPQNTLAVALARFLYTPKKIILDCDDFELTANVLSSLIQRAAIHTSERLACKISDSIVAATPFLQDHLTYLTNSKKQVILIPTGLNASSLNMPNGEPNLLYAGSVSLSSGHRVDMLVTIMKLLQPTYPHLTLHVAGSGDDSATLKEAAAQQGVASQIVWHGRFDEKSLGAILTSQTILVDPIDSTIVARAKSSFRCMLATTYGLPVVTSNVGIRTQLLPTSLHGRLFAEPGSPASYAEKISLLLITPLSESGRIAMKDTAREYSWGKLASKYKATMNL